MRVVSSLVALTLLSFVAASPYSVPSNQGGQGTSTVNGTQPRVSGAPTGTWLGSSTPSGGSAHGHGQGHNSSVSSGGSTHGHGQGHNSSVLAAPTASGHSGGKNGGHGGASGSPQGAQPSSGGKGNGNGNGNGHNGGHGNGSAGSPTQTTQPGGPIIPTSPVPTATTYA